MGHPNARDPTAAPCTIEIRLHDLAGLFNSFDPSPFPEKDLDHDAEEFIVGWANELPRRGAIHLRVHLARPSNETDAAGRIIETVHFYFAYREAMARLKIRRLLETGRSALVTGLAFLVACLWLAGRLGEHDAAGAGLHIVRESLIIGGWVAMWRPMEIFLYEWWPLRHERRVLERLSRCTVEVIEPDAAPPAA